MLQRSQGSIEHFVFDLSLFLSHLAYTRAPAFVQHRFLYIVIERCSDVDKIGNTVIGRRDRCDLAPGESLKERDS